MRFWFCVEEVRFGVLREVSTQVPPTSSCLGNGVGSGGVCRAPCAHWRRQPLCIHGGGLRPRTGLYDYMARVRAIDKMTNPCLHGAADNAVPMWSREPGKTRLPPSGGKTRLSARL